MRLERVGQIVNVHHCFAHTGRTQAVQAMIEERLARHFNERLRTGCGQRPHALAEPGGHHHGDLRHLS